MRGTVPTDPAAGDIWRITPARAGNSHHRGGSRQHFWDHPRACGEQAYAGVSGAWQMGSPPRVRGTDYNSNTCNRTNRITPARAGNSALGLLGRVSHGDHPRACGEQSSLISPVSMVQGSPPRVRGTGPGRRMAGRVCRITPARAGNRGQQAFRVIAGEDHPRACGEQPPAFVFDLCFIGSPPRVRGTGPSIPCGPIGPGITPARAGNSYSLCCPRTQSQDHPRACGEQKPNNAKIRNTKGSPPRVRGTDPNR